MAQSPSQDRDNLARYKAEEAKLVEVRTRSVAGFEAAQARGDLAAAQRWCEELKTAGDAFQGFRESLSPDTRAHITASRILEGSGFERLGFLERFVRQPALHVRIPAGVSDMEALEALNEYFPRHYKVDMPVVNPTTFSFLVNEGGAAQRNITLPRAFDIFLVVPGSAGKSRDEQMTVLERLGLTFALPIEQVLGGAVSMCIAGKKAVTDRYVHRGTSSQVGLDSSTWPEGVIPFSFVSLTDQHRHKVVCASGVRR